MSKPKKRVPEIRFKGFTDDWEQRKLSDVAEFNPKSDLPNQFEYVDLESVIGTELTSHRTETLSSAPSRAQRLAEKGDIFYQTVRPYQKNNYLFDLPYDNYVFSTGYAQIRPTIYNYFLFYRLQEERFVSNVLRWSTGTSYPAISSNDLAQIKVNITLEHKEQILIGNFLKQLDNTITLHQRKLDQLKQLKKGYMQVLFPQRGGNMPKVRFADFDNKWEQRKLKEVVEITMGHSPNGENYTDNPDDHILVQGNADIKMGWVTPRVWTTQVTKTANIGDIILSVRAPVGDVGRTQYNVVLGRGVAGIQGGEFIFYTLTKMKFNGFWRRYSTGSTFESINSSDLKDAIIFTPEEDEQIKIGKLLSNLEKTIALHHSKLDKLSSLKKAYLQKMFI